MKAFSLLICFFSFPFFSQAQTTFIDLLEDYDNCIWTANPSGVIHTWQVSGGTASLLDIFQNNAPTSIAIGHIKVSSDTTLNTFITADFFSGNASYWNGDEWKNLPITIPNLPIGVGAYKSDIYFYDNDGVHYYNGTNLITNIYPKKINSIADITVDSLGQAWIVDIGEHGAFSFLDTVTVINQSGDILHQFPLGFELATGSGYGLTMLNDTIYMGFNATNMSFPNKIIKVVINNGIAELAGELIEFNGLISNFNDLASETPGSPLANTTSVHDFAGIKSEKINFYPNPVKDKVTIEAAGFSGKTTVNLYKIDGRFLRRFHSNGYPIILDLNTIEKGNYLMTLKNSSGILRSFQFIKE